LSSTRRSREVGALALLFCLSLAAVRSGYAQAPPPPPPPTAPITMQQAVEQALAHNPVLLSAQQNLLSMKGQEVEAGLRANPVLALSGSDVSLSTSNPAGPYFYSADVSRLFERGQKRRWRLDSARATTAQTEAQYHDQIRQMTLQVKQSFTNLLLARATLKLAQDNLSSFRHELQINHDRYDAGDIGKLDYERLDLQLAQFESDESNSEMNLAQASDQLQTLMGRGQPTRNFEIAGELVPPSLPTTLAGLEQKALTARPDYQAAQSAVRVADANVKLAYANGTTDPTLEGEYDRSGDYNSGGFSISIPLRIFDRNQGNKDTSKYLAQASRFGEVAAQNQVYSDVDQAWIGYTTSKVLSDRYNGHYLAEAKDVLSIAQFAYEHGGLALLDYLSALQDDRTTSLNALNSYAQTWMAIHQVSFASATEVVP
jgi:cobalt-zinc-cadmium efflux system outer membrane protein